MKCHVEVPSSKNPAPSTIALDAEREKAVSGCEIARESDRTAKKEQRRNVFVCLFVCLFVGWLVGLRTTHQGRPPAAPPPPPLGSKSHRGRRSGAPRSARSRRCSTGASRRSRTRGETGTSSRCCCCSLLLYRALAWTPAAPLPAPLHHSHPRHLRHSRWCSWSRSGSRCSPLRCRTRRSERRTRARSAPHRSKSHPW